MFGLPKHGNYTGLAYSIRDKLQRTAYNADVSDIFIHVDVGYSEQHKAVVLDVYVDYGRENRIFSHNMIETVTMDADLNAFIRKIETYIDPFSDSLIAEYYASKEDECSESTSITEQLSRQTITSTNGTLMVKRYLSLMEICSLI